MKLQICKGSVSIGGKRILKNIQFEVKGIQKIAVIGPNGAGKSTLLSLIAGELTPDPDDKNQGPVMIRARETLVDYIHQHELSDHHESLFDYERRIIKDKEDRYRFDNILTGMGFSLKDKSKSIDQFSGGERKKIALIRLLLSDADIILLDEPDNHLDMESLVWLENHLRSMNKAVVFVSHDRSFIDHVADVVYELKDGTLKKYTGNYSDYRKQKESEYHAKLTAWKAQQQKIERLQKTIETFKHKPNKSAMARSKMKYLDRMEKIEKPDMSDQLIKEHIIIPEIKGPKLVFELNDLAIGYGTALLSDINLRIRRKDACGILGKNGTGKTTLLKTILGSIPSCSGNIIRGDPLTIGYYDQLTSEFASDCRVFEYFSNHFPDQSITEVKHLLACYLFRGEDTEKYVKDLSGGEKCRLALALILERKPNVLILDEPTNNMDLEGKEAVETILKNYEGTLIFVSHDRYFVKSIATSLMIMDANTVNYYPFGYEHYLDSLKRITGHSSISDMIMQENHRLVDELSEVPKPRHIQAKQLTTEQETADWKLKLVLEKLNDTKEKLHALSLCKMSEAYFTDISYQQSIDQDMKLYHEIYHHDCLEWYEKYIDAVDLADMKDADLFDA